MITVGWLLITLGALWLLQNLGLLPRGLWEIFWPIVVILIGVKLVWPNKWDKMWKDMGGKKIKIE